MANTTQYDVRTQAYSSIILPLARQERSMLYDRVFVKKEGITAFADVYPGKVHAFDMMMPWSKHSKQAAKTFRQHFLYAVNHYRAQQSKIKNH